MLLYSLLYPIIYYCTTTTYDITDLRYVNDLVFSTCRRSSKYCLSTLFTFTTLLLRFVIFFYDFTCIMDGEASSARRVAPLPLVKRRPNFPAAAFLLPSMSVSKS